MTDIRDAWRALRATPIVSIVVVLSLALGIGANTAIFSLINAITLRPIAAQDPDGLFVVSATDSGPFGTYGPWHQIRDERMFAQTFAWSQPRLNLAPGGQAEFVERMRTSGEIYDVLGVRAFRGRLLTEGDFGQLQFWNRSCSTSSHEIQPRWRSPSACFCSPVQSPPSGRRAVQDGSIQRSF